MHCTQKLKLEKILGLHYRGFEILTLVFTQACELAPSKNWQFSRWVEKVRLAPRVNIYDIRSGDKLAGYYCVLNEVGNRLRRVFSK